ncbi:MAG: hypothetical protein ACOYBT_09900 [Polynucleobacter sp.]
MDAFVAGAWRSPDRGEVLISGTWRRLTRAELYQGGQWRSAVRFVPALTVSANDVFGVGYSRYGRPVVVQSDFSTATPEGGLAPYSYAWTILSGSAVANNTTSASTNFEKALPPGTESQSTARVSCTDALGSTAIADISVTLIANEAGDYL